MLEVILENSISYIKNPDELTNNDLTEDLSYVNKAEDYNYTKGIRTLAFLKQRIEAGHPNLEGRFKQTQFLVNQANKKRKVKLYDNGKFPTGLLHLVEEYLQKFNIEYKLIDKRKKPKLLKHKFVTKTSFPPLRYYQQEAIKKALEKERGVLSMATGTGKTLTLSKIIWELGVNTLIITPNKEINNMMFDTMIKYFGKGKVSKLTSKSKIDKPINIGNIQALIKLDPSTLKDIDLVIIDEFHHSAAETYREVNEKLLNNCYYRFGMTGTFFRNDGSDLALHGVLSEAIYEYDAPRAIKEGFLVKPTFINIPFNNEGRRKYQTEYKECLVENELRNELIADLMKEYNNRPMLVLVQQVAHGELLKDLTGAAFIHGQLNDTERQKLLSDFNSGKINTLIGTSVIGEGVDLPRAEILIMAGGGKSRSQIIQNIGRVLRPFEGKVQAIIVDITDDGSNFLEGHNKLRNDIYRDYN